MNTNSEVRHIFLRVSVNLSLETGYPAQNSIPIILWLQILQATVVMDERCAEDIPTCEGGSSRVWSSYVVHVTKHVRCYMNNKSREMG